MSKVTLRPNEEIHGTLPGASEIVGAESRWQAISDDSDVSYVAIGEGLTSRQFGLTDSTLPEGSVLKSFTSRVRVAGSPSGELVCGVVNSGNLMERKIYPAFTAPTTITLATEPGMRTGSLSDVQLVFLLSKVKLYEAYLDVVYVEKPTLTVDAPTGTLETSNHPTVEWSDTLDSDGGAQTYYEVKVFTKAVAEAEGFDADTATGVVESEVQSGSPTTWTPGAVLADGDYRAYVRVAQTVNSAQHWSDWAYESFSVEVALPALPTLTITPEDDDGRIRVAIEEGAEGDATTGGFQVQWSHDGTTWTDLRTADGGGLAEGTSATLYDYEAPNGSQVKYRARAWHEYEGAQRAWSDWTEKAAVWESADRWLKHPTDPSLNVKVEPYSYPGSTRTARMGNFQPLGRTDPIVVADTRTARTGSLVLWVDDEEGQDALDAILATLAPLLLQMAPQDKRKDRWVQMGTVEEKSIVDKLAAEDALVTLEWVGVGRP